MSGEKIKGFPVNSRNKNEKKELTFELKGVWLIPIRVLHQ